MAEKQQNDKSRIANPNANPRFRHHSMEWKRGMRKKERLGRRKEEEEADEEAKGGESQLGEIDYGGCAQGTTIMAGNDRLIGHR